jgi:hypothetical protein
VIAESHRPESLATLETVERNPQNERRNSVQNPHSELGKEGLSQECPERWRENANQQSKAEKLDGN